MKLPARNILIAVTLAMLSLPLFAQTNRPAPCECNWKGGCPGKADACREGEIGNCHCDDEGNCVNSCETQAKEPLQLAVQIVNRVANVNLTIDQLKEQSEKYRPILDELIKNDYKYVEYNKKRTGFGFSREGIKLVNKADIELRRNRVVNPRSTMRITDALVYPVRSDATYVTANAFKEAPKVSPAPVSRRSKSVITKSAAENYRLYMEAFRKKTERLRARNLISRRTYQKRIKTYGNGIERSKELAKNP